MRSRLAILFTTAVTVLPVMAQNVTEEPQADPVLEAIHEFTQNDKASSEVAIVLEPAAQPPAETEKPPAETAPEAAKPAEAAGGVPGLHTPVFVNGRPPEGSTVAGEHAPEASIPLPEEAPEKKPEEGLSVRIEKLHGGIGAIDAAKVKLMAPFPAKPLAQAPAGWHLEAKNHAPPFTREVELSPGSKITLSIRPHLLVPDADGASVFTISEPGYDNTVGYQQTATVGAILSNSIRQLDEDSKRLGVAIDSLQQLLISLPKPEPAPMPEQAPRAIPARKR